MVVYRQLKNQISDILFVIDNHSYYPEIDKKVMCVFSNWKLNLISMKISTRFYVYVTKHAANWFAAQILEATRLN